MVSYKILKMALMIPQPKDHVFVEPMIYQYDALWLLAECTFQLERYKETYEAFIKLLSIQSLPADYRRQLEILLPRIRELGLD